MLNLIDILTLMLNLIWKKVKFKIGGYVRISRYGNTFLRSYIWNWTGEVWLK